MVCVLFYGFFLNLNNFGMDQNYIQRYHTAKTSRQASRSIWLCVAMYVPASFLFFIIGTALYAFYQVQPQLIDPVKLQLATSHLGASADPEQIKQMAAALKPSEYGDKVLPFFIFEFIFETAEVAENNSQKFADFAS